MQQQDIDAVQAAIDALERQRTTLGDAVVDLATAPLRARLAGQQRQAGLHHRQVTVLFADVVGSTAMIQTLEAEDALDLLNGAMSAMAALVEAQRGRVLRFTGDGLKAVFGAEEAREDDAVRAVRAGLAILAGSRALAEDARRRFGLEGLALRVGVHTGDVAMGAGVERQDTALGPAVHIAARMEQTASPGTLRISHDTWSLVRGLFEMTAQPPLEVKGLSAPMQTYLVSAERDEASAGLERGLQGLSTPMVGRDAELRQLLELAERARDTQVLQSSLLIADAGLGKSRLLRELVARLTGCRVLTLRSPPDGTLRPWGLVRGLLVALDALGGLDGSDSVERSRQRLVEALFPWFEGDAERPCHLLGQLAGLDFRDSPHVRGLEPRSLREQAGQAFVACLRGLAERGGALPVILAEDLHWADEGSLDLLELLQAHASELPLALVMTARPGLLERRPGGCTEAPQIRLPPLPAAAAGTLAAALLQRLDRVPPRLAELLIGRAEGNPYYLEELVRRLVDEGVIVLGEPHWTVQPDRLDSVRLPPTLVGLLQARLDALPAADRLAARQASVIGHVFWDDALQELDALALRALPALERSTYVRRRDTSGIDGTTERQFDHHLLHEVTYGTLLKDERRRSHGAVARWLSARARGRGPAFLALIAEHAARGGETTLAIEAFEQAGHEAQQRYANDMATTWLTRALELLGSSEPGRRLQLLGRLESLADLQGDRAEQEAWQAEMARLLDAHPDDQGTAHLHWCRALLADRRSDAARAREHLQHAIEQAERSGAAHTAARARGLRAWLCLQPGDFEAAREHVATGLAWAARIEADELRALTEAQLLTIRSMLSKELGRFDEARGALRDVLARGEALPSVRLQSSAMDNLADIAQRLGRWEEVLDWAGRARALARTTGGVRDEARALSRLGLANWSLGRREEAQVLCEQALMRHRRVGDRYMEAVTLCMLGWLAFDRGDPQVALDFSRQAQATYEHPTATVQACEATSLAALCLARLGEADAARQAVETVVASLEGPLHSLGRAAAIDSRWTCYLALAALGDPGAGTWLGPLRGDVHARAAALTDEADRPRLIEALPLYRAIEVASRG